MSLTPHELKALDAIEQDLTARHPELAQALARMHPIPARRPDGVPPPAPPVPAPAAAAFAARHAPAPPPRRYGVHVIIVALAVAALLWAAWSWPGPSACPTSAASRSRPAVTSSAGDPAVPGAAAGCALEPSAA